MVLKLSLAEVQKICDTCEQYVRDGESCRTGAEDGIKSLREVRRCRKWDQFYGSPCLYSGQ